MPSLGRGSSDLSRVSPEGTDAAEEGRVGGWGFLGFAAFAGLLFLLVAATITLANVVAPWLSALIVGLVVTAIGVALLAKGRSSISSTNLVPERTVHSVQKDVELAKSEVRR